MCTIFQFKRYFRFFLDWMAWTKTRLLEFYLFVRWSITPNRQYNMLSNLRSLCHSSWQFGVKLQVIWFWSKSQFFLWELIFITAVTWQWKCIFLGVTGKRLLRGSWDNGVDRLKWDPGGARGKSREKIMKEMRIWPLFNSLQSLTSFQQKCKMSYQTMSIK